MVIQGRSFMGRSNDLKPKEVVSLLLDDEEIEKKYQEQSTLQVCCNKHLTSYFDEAWKIVHLG